MQNIIFKFVCYKQRIFYQLSKCKNVESESKDLMVLGTIKHGVKKFDKIQKMTQIKPEELNLILKQLEERGFIQAEKKKGLFGMKVEIIPIEKGSKEVDERAHELQTKWDQMSLLHKSGDKEKLKQEMKNNKSFISSMMFFGIIDMVMFSMMFSMMGMVMTDYVAPENMPETGDEGMDDGGFDFDIGF